MSFLKPEFKAPITKEMIAELNSVGLLSVLGIKISGFDGTMISGSFEVGAHHLAPNGYLHAGSIVALADSLCGIGCQLALPDGALTFTTIELKTNFLSTSVDGLVTGTAHLIHGGRTTQVWDASILSDNTGRRMAEFRCTQLIIYPAKRIENESG